MMILNSVQQVVNPVNPLNQIYIVPSYAIVSSYAIDVSLVIGQTRSGELNIDLKSRVQELNLPEANYEFAA